MKKTILITLALVTTFCLGFAFKTVTTKQTTTKRVTGIGGIFFKCKDPKKTLVDVLHEKSVNYTLRNLAKNGNTNHLLNTS